MESFCRVRDSPERRIATYVNSLGDSRKHVRQSEKKARLVVKGFEESFLDLSDSPTVAKPSIRTVLNIIAMKKWSLECIDIRAAFFQKGNINHEVILMPPKEANESGFWRLKKTVYGLDDAARSWYFTAKTKLCSLGCSVSVDPGVFTWVENGELCGIVCLHVDDFLIAGDHSFHEKVLTPNMETFELGSYQKKQFKYLYWEFFQR